MPCRVRRASSLPADLPEIGERVERARLATLPAHDAAFVVGLVAEYRPHAPMACKLNAARCDAWCRSMRCDAVRALPDRDSMP